MEEIGACIKPKLNIGCFMGGCPIQDDIRVARKCDIITGTPGRIVDLYKRGELKLNRMKMLVLDEADELLKPSRDDRDDSNSFESHLNTIVRAMHPKAQIVIVSATITEDTLRVCDELLRDPNRILLKPETLSLRGIRQYNLYIDTKSQRIPQGAQGEDMVFQMKCRAVNIVLVSIPTRQTMIFAKKENGNRLYEQMLEEKYSVVFLHGDMTWKERRDATREFKSGNARFMIATDVVARGFDSQSVSLVINFDLPCGPMGSESYLHRIGRSGRHGRKGTAINICVKGYMSSNPRGGRSAEPNDISKTHGYSKQFGCEIEELPDDLSCI
jgi:ATP-dependent RNA helicase